ncbi:MAG: hypothetical protein ACTHLZ_15480, partial [Tepidisphaeraceae bacterium]
TLPTKTIGLVEGTSGIPEFAFEAQIRADTERETFRPCHFIAPGVKLREPSFTPQRKTFIHPRNALLRGNCGVTIFVGSSCNASRRGFLINRGVRIQPPDDALIKTKLPAHVVKKRPIHRLR